MTKERQNILTLILSGIGVGVTSFGALAGLLWLIISLAIAPIKENQIELKDNIKEIQQQLMSRDELDLRINGKVKEHKIIDHK